MTTAPHARRAAMASSLAASLLIVALALLGGCGADSSLPERPALFLDDFSSEVRAQIEAADQAVSATPEDADANGAAAMILHAYAQREWAEIYYRRAASLAPDTLRWTYLHGVVLEDLGRNAQALSVMRQALKLEPDYAPARLRAANLLLDGGELDAALSEYRALEAMRPDSARVQLGLGKLAVARGDLAAGVSLLERATRMQTPYGEAHFALIAAYRQQDMLDKAREQTTLFEKFRGREPSWDDPLLGDVSERNQSISGRLARAQRYLNEKRLDAARRDLDAVLADDPENAAAHNLSIVVHGALGDAATAEAHYDAALAIAPDMAQLHSNFGVLRLQQQRLDEAATAFSEAIRVDPDYGSAYLNLGAVREKQGRREEAVALYRAAIERAPGNRQAHYFLGKQLERSGKLNAAVDAYRAALTPEDGKTPWYLRALAGAYARLQRYDDAIAALEQARDVARQHRQGAAITTINNELRRVEAQRDAALSRLTSQ